MGCMSSTEQLEAKIGKLKLERNEIREKRKKKIARLEALTGEKVKREPVPDCFKKTENDKSTSKEKKENN